jgi:hypothetical protein
MGKDRCNDIPSQILSEEKLINTVLRNDFLLR